MGEKRNLKYWCDRCDEFEHSACAKCLRGLWGNRGTPMSPPGYEKKPDSENGR